MRLASVCNVLSECVELFYLNSHAFTATSLSQAITLSEQVS